MSRICYFKQHGASGLALAADLTTLEGVVDGKAEASVVTTLSSTVDAKANSADVYLQTDVDALLADKLVAADIADKVDSAYLGQVVNDINDALGNRAQVNNVYTKTATDALLDDKADASALASKLEAADIAGKLDSADFNTRVGHENAFFTAMSECLYLESGVGTGVEFSYTSLLGV